jgi:YfiH family protein
MPFHEINNIRFFTFESFDAHGIPHAVFTRYGGVSPSPWKGLNLARVGKDDAGRLQANVRTALEGLGRDPESVGEVAQVHGDGVILLEAASVAGDSPPDGDAILTSNPDLTLLMRFADCVPILLYDPFHNIASIAHAGWRGTVKKVVKKTVKKMTETYGSDPAEILAGIGPSICAAHYEVGQEVAAEIQSAFPDTFQKMVLSTNGRVHLDLWAANRLALEEAGVRQIEVSGLCTAENLEDWYSHRGENGKTGRFGAMIGVKHE